MDWKSARRVREPVAWILLTVTAISLLIGILTLFGAPGSAYESLGSQPGFGSGIIAHLRAAAAFGDFTAATMTILPVLAVLLVTIAGGPTGRAGQVTMLAAAEQGLALGLGLSTFIGALATDPSPLALGYLSDAGLLGFVAAGLILTVAIHRSGALRASG